MKHDQLSNRQLAVLIMTALITPTIALLPTLTTRLAGSAAWLSLVGAIPLLSLACWAAKGLFAAETGKKPGAGKCTIIILYLLWVVIVLAVILRLCEARLSRLYGEPGGGLCTAAVLLAALWMGWGKRSAFARAGEIFYLALSVLIIGILLLAAGQVEWSSLEVKGNELIDLVPGSLASAGLLLNVCPAMVLVQWVSQRAEKGKCLIRILVFCTVAALLIAVVIGCLGAKLTARVPAPFYIMLQGLGIKGAFQRLEAPVAALLTLSDLILMGLLLHAWRGLAVTLRPGKWARAGIIPVAGGALIGEWVFLREAETLWYFGSTVLPVMGVCLGLALPVLVKGIKGINRIMGRR